MIPDTRYVVPSDPATFPTVLHTLYGPIHKGLRAELSRLIHLVAVADAEDADAAADLSDQISGLQIQLESHAHHEDEWIEPVLEELLPDVAEVIEAEHARFEPVYQSLIDVAASLTAADVVERAALLQLLHLDLCRFTSGYLAHMDTEERLAMPRLEEALGEDGVLDLHQKVLASIDPAVMMHAQSFMLPAMNPQERLGMMMGIRMSAPPEAFEASMALAQSVLSEENMEKLTAGLAGA